LKLIHIFEVSCEEDEQQHVKKGETIIKALYKTRFIQLILDVAKRIIDTRDIPPDVSAKSV
jgi:hypothetical protein